jgi:hypothetical protein
MGIALVLPGGDFTDEGLLVGEPSLVWWGMPRPPTDRQGLERILTFLNNRSFTVNLVLGVILPLRRQTA